MAVEALNAPEEGLHFDLPVVEPAVPESGTFEIRGAETSENVPVAEEPGAMPALDEVGSPETEQAEPTQETSTEITTPAAAETNGHNGGVWSVLNRLSALAHGAVRKLVDALPR